MRRAFVIVLDACGAGALPDAADYGDAGSDTLGHLAAAVGGLRMPALQALGLGCALELDGVPPSRDPVMHGRLAAIGPGKDSTAGHWGLMGLVAAERPVYPEGFPDEVLAVIERAGAPGVLGNHPSNGIEAIERYGEAHLLSGEPILYTSQDSVLQLAAHVDVLAPAELYALCEAVRERLPRQHAVGRVIARPFAGEPGAFVRTDGRRDYALAPDGPSYLDKLQATGVPTHAVGKVHALFAGAGFDAAHPGATNATALAETRRLMSELESGFVFTNLIETDQVYGHRHDCPGFASALTEIDRHVAAWLPALGAEDLLVLTADHGCDPTGPHTDHTREYAPLLAWFAGHGGRRHDGVLADVGASTLDWLTGRSAPGLPGESFL
ncbi:MAG TPA: phosphopentomutase [Solirubrobacteraceae bacterium]|nr:phosphopentomutase [Solirubrobacteraceae bacterium]